MYIRCDMKVHLRLVLVIHVGVVYIVVEAHINGPLEECVMYFTSFSLLEMKSGKHVLFFLLQFSKIRWTAESKIDLVF